MLGRIAIARTVDHPKALTAASTDGPTTSLRTTSLLRFVGRWIPGIGWALLAVDLEVIDQCYANCRGKRSYLRTACEELTPFCAKSAY